MKPSSPQLVAKWTAEAASWDFDFLEKGKQRSAQYRHRVCGHVDTFALGNMRKGLVRCTLCQEGKLQEEANKVGFDFLEKNERRSARYRCRVCGHVDTHLVGGMQKGTIRCTSCQEAQWREEADKWDFDFLEKVDRASALYRHRACGHVDRFYLCSMRKGSVRCTPCQEARWREEADKWDFDLLEKVDQHSAQYKCKACGHVDIFEFGNMRKGSVRCTPCQEAKWREEADKWDFDLLENDNGVSARYRHRVCGHVDTYRFDHMRDGSVRCTPCQEAKWREEADKVGYEFLGKVKVEFAEYRHKACGHVDTHRIGQMRSGSVHCDNCEQSRVSACHQWVKIVLDRMAPYGVTYRENYRIGCKPNLRNTGKDGPAWADLLIGGTNPKILIEIDGEQHFDRNSRHKTEDDFKRQVLRDVFVEEDAKDQGMLVLRFGTWEERSRIEDTVLRTLQGRLKKHRLAESIPLDEIRVHDLFWLWRKEGKSLYQERRGRK